MERCFVLMPVTGKQRDMGLSVEFGLRKNGGRGNHPAGYHHMYI
jgi:hypothetical protein